MGIIFFQFLIDLFLAIDYATPVPVSFPKVIFFGYHIGG
jgi:hypothetical protein